MKYALTFILLLSGQMATAATNRTLRDRAKPYLESALDAGQPFVVVSAASGMPNVAADSLASILGQGLAAQTQTGTSPYPTSLSGISVQIVDSVGVSRLVPLLYAAPDQVNLLVPVGVAAGAATINILNGAQVSLSGTLQIQPVAPALFTANENGEGVVSATAYHTVIPTTIAVPVAVYQCVDRPGTCVSVPLSLGVDVVVYVTANATGLRGRSSDAAVKLTIGGQPVQIRSITAQDDGGASAGIDQIFFPVPLSLRGAGEVPLVLSVDGTTSNTSRINIM